MAPDQTFLEARIIPVPFSGCWIWLGSLNGDGYGTMRVLRGGKYRQFFAHKVIYESSRGSVPAGKELDHLCRVRCCVNPDHLEPVTHQENIARGQTGIVNRSKTACRAGHPYDERNTRIYEGRRHCRICARAHSQKHREKVAP